MIPISINNKDTLTKWQIRKLNKKGLKLCGEEYCGIVDIKTSKRLEKYSKKHGLEFKNLEDTVEEVDFVKRYFEMNSPVLGDKYQCVYCGKILDKDKTEVDHLYPVSKVKKSSRIQKRLIKRGILSVDDNRNLVCSCGACIKKKGQKMGKWIFRGRIGKYPLLWGVRYVARIIIIISMFILGTLIAAGIISI